MTILLSKCVGESLENPRSRYINQGERDKQNLGGHYRECYLDRERGLIGETTRMFASCMPSFSAVHACCRRSFQYSSTVTNFFSVLVFYFLCTWYIFRLFGIPFEHIIPKNILIEKMRILSVQYLSPLASNYVAGLHMCGLFRPPAELPYRPGNIPAQPSDVLCYWAGPQTIPWGPENDD